ncbi:hypothetical protein [Simkania sp.]|uniref:hypothetical protein n=1 Tax=Simkania sp. TaxID=34094 RepID=UPI003B521D38
MTDLTNNKVEPHQSGFGFEQILPPQQEALQIERGNIPPPLDLIAMRDRIDEQIESMVRDVVNRSRAEFTFGPLDLLSGIFNAIRAVLPF